MTFFVCLLFVVLSSAIFVCLDGVLLFEGKGKGGMLQAGAGEHLMANYNEPLAEKYRLYYLDPRTKETLESRVHDYFQTALGVTENGSDKQPLLRLQVKETEVHVSGTPQEESCRFFKEQIEKTVQYDLVGDVISVLPEDVMTQAEKGQDEMDQLIDNMEKEPDKADGQNSLDTAQDPSYAAEEMEEALNTAPGKTLRRIFQKGILSYVTDGAMLSDRNISISSLPSNGQKEPMISLTLDILGNIENIKEAVKGQSLDELAQMLSEKGYLALYNKKYFGNYRNKKENTALQYEYEYILGGRNSDEENLEYTVKRLVLLRFALNAVRIFSDPSKQEEALLLAAAAAGFSGSPVIVESVKNIILGMYSMEEAFEDVRVLMSGKSVPIMKKTETDYEEGVTYEDYLVILFLLHGNENRKCLRMQDLMQLNIEMEQPEFRMKDCCQIIQIRTVMEQTGLFLGRVHQYQWNNKFQY